MRDSHTSGLSRRSGRAKFGAVAFVAVMWVAACGGAASAPLMVSPTVPKASTPLMVSPAVPEASARPSTTPTATGPAAPGTASSAPSTGTSKSYSSDQGPSITLPSEWIALTSSDVTNPEVLVPLRLKSSREDVNNLVRVLGQHPEYWLVGVRRSDMSVLTAQVRTAADFDAWASEQQANLEAVYPDVARADLTTPRHGVAFSFTANGIPSRMYGFARPGGVAIFLLAGGPTAPATWDDVVAGFTDASG